MINHFGEFYEKLTSSKIKREQPSSRHIRWAIFIILDRANAFTKFNIPCYDSMVSMFFIIKKKLIKG